MANYSVVRYLNTRYGTQSGASLLQEWSQRYGSRSAEDLPIDSPSTTFGSWNPYRRTVYIHGSFLLDALEGEIGEAAFAGLLRDYSSEYRYKIASTEGFLALAQGKSETDLTPLYSEWISPERVP